MKRKYKKIIASLLVGIMLMPSVSYAKVRSSHHSSYHSKSSISTSRSRTSTYKSSPTKLKSGTTTLRPKSGTSIPRSTKKTTTTNNKTTTTTNTNKNKSTTTKSKVFSIKKKSSNIKPVKINTSKYSTTPSSYYSSNSSFWKYYGISKMLEGNKDVSEKDIAEELAKKGYSQSEIDNILNDAKKENTTKVNTKQNKKESNPTIVFLFICAISICIGLLFFVLFRRI